MSGYEPPADEIVYLLPNAIRLHTDYDVRPFSARQGPSQEETKRIERLARSIEDNGQIESLVLTPERVLVAGHRRRVAVMLINERRSARGQPLVRLRCQIDHSGGDMRRKAIQSNLQRREATVMDIAFLCAQLREQHDWRGWPGTKALGEYLGLDPVTVSQNEFFLGAEKELQNKLHDGLISAQSARVLMAATPSAEERQKLLARAAVIQAENRTSDLVDRYHSGKLSPRAATKGMVALRNAEAAPETTRIKHPAVIQAIRERHLTAQVSPAASKKMALSRAELLHAIGQFDDASYLPAAREFARYFTGEFAKGRGTVDELRARFQALWMPSNTGAAAARKTVAD